MTSILQARWQEIAFAMMMGWMGWLSLMVFSQQNSIRLLEVQISIRNGEDMQTIKERLTKIEK